MARTRRTNKTIFLSKVPDDGSTIGNMTLIEKLSWEEEKYWSVRGELISDGVIALGKGKGGSVFRATAEPKRTKDGKKSPYPTEKSLYKPFLEVVQHGFIRDKTIKNYVCQITANQGKKILAGNGLGQM